MSLSSIPAQVQSRTESSPPRSSDSNIALETQAGFANGLDLNQHQNQNQNQNQNHHQQTNDPIHKSRKRSAEAPASSTLSSPYSSGSDNRQKRAASEPLQPRTKHSPPSPLSTLSSTDLPHNNMAGILPLEILIYLASLLSEPDLIRLSLTSKRIRTTLLGVPFLWAKCLTVEISDLSMADQIQTLFLDRALAPLHLGLLPTTGLISRWVTENDQPSLPRLLKKLVIRLLPPAVTLDERTNRLIFIQDQTYWNTTLLAHNIRILKSLMSSLVGRPAGLEALEIKLDGQFDNTLGVAHELWSLVQTPWARSVVDYRFSVAYPYARLPPRTILGLTAWMPNLQRLELHVAATSAQRRAANRHPKMVLGTLDFAEPSTSDSSAVSSPEPICNLERLAIAGFDLGQIALPTQLPRLANLEIRNVTWGRMLFELLRRSPFLVSLTVWGFEFELSEADEDLPPDWPFWDSVEEEMSEPGSEDLGPRPPAITLHALRELELGGMCTPAIWTVISEPIPNPVIRMPGLKRLILESMELDEEEHALHELPVLAPLIRELSVRQCTLRDEADVYHCIRCLPYLEVLDLRQTEHITSNLVNALALSVPNIVHLDVRGCGWVQIASVARLAETVRDSSDGVRRLAHVGVDMPLPEDWEGWEAWRWLEFTHVLLDEEEWKERRRFRKDKGRVREEAHQPVLMAGTDLGLLDPDGGGRSEVLGPAGSVGSLEESEEEEDEEEEEEEEELESEEELLEEERRAAVAQAQPGTQIGRTPGPGGGGVVVDSGGDTRQGGNRRVVLARS